MLMSLGNSVNLDLFYYIINDITQFVILLHFIILPNYILYDVIIILLLIFCIIYKYIL